MPDSAFSRRALFTLGVARVADEIVPASEPPPHAPASVPAAPPVDREDWAARQRAARARCDGELWAPAVTALLAAGERHHDRRLLAAGDDLCALPYADASLDCALSAFGPMFDLDARGAVGELFRVVRPGGTVAFTAWTAGGIVGRLLRLAAEHDPPPRGIAKPLTWGREERLRQDLEEHSDQVEFERRAIELCFDGREDAVERLCGALQPLAAVAAQSPFRAAALECVDALSDDGVTRLTLRAPYVLARAIRRNS